MILSLAISCIILSELSVSLQTGAAVDMRMRNPYSTLCSPSILLVAVCSDLGSDTFCCLYYIYTVSDAPLLLCALHLWSCYRSPNQGKGRGREGEGGEGGRDRGGERGSSSSFSTTSFFSLPLPLPLPLPLSLSPPSLSPPSLSPSLFICLRYYLSSSSYAFCSQFDSHQLS